MGERAFERSRLRSPERSQVELTGQFSLRPEALSRIPGAPIVANAPAAKCAAAASQSRPRFPVNQSWPGRRLLPPTQCPRTAIIFSCFGIPNSFACN